MILGLGATLPNHIPACRSEFIGGSKAVTGLGENLYFNCMQGFNCMNSVIFKLCTGSITVWWKVSKHGGGDLENIGCLLKHLEVEGWKNLDVDDNFPIT